MIIPGYYMSNKDKLQNDVKDQSQITHLYEAATAWCMYLRIWILDEYPFPSLCSRRIAYF